MILFWMICLVLLIVALLFIVLPLWRKPANNDVLCDEANLDILRDQSAELEADLRNGLLTQEAFDQGKRELQVRLLEETGDSAQPVRPSRGSSRVLPVLLLLMVPVFSILLYLYTGNLRALLPQEISADGIVRSEAVLQALEKKLEQSPDKAEGWLVLARSYAELQRFPEAVRAYRKLVELVPEEAQLWADYADVQAMDNGQSLLGEPTALLEKALALDGNNTSALALSGSAAMERADYAAAIAHWEKLISLLPPDYPNLQVIHDGVRQAQDLLAMGKRGMREGDGKALAVSGLVMLSPDLAGKVAPGDTVFILARAVNGPRMPLAVLRKQAGELPLSFSLDDSMAMQAQTRLSAFEQVMIVARVSKSGNPVAQPGDLEGVSPSVKPGSSGLKIVIDTVVP